MGNAVLRKCSVAEQGSDSEATSAARILALDVVDSFAAVRDYLREVEKLDYFERVDAHLRNNAGLVSRLVDWEKGWEVGAKYVQNSHVLDAICDLVAVIRTAQMITPELKQMCDDCDVELFMVLPRIMWLRFLAAPWKYTALLRSLLPKSRFGDAITIDSYDDELRGFVDKVQKAKELLTGALLAGAISAMTTEQVQAAAWELLMKRVVLGVANTEAVYGNLAPAFREAAQSAVEDLMIQDLERFSMELQRHCPQDWNQCSAILVRCLHGDGQTTRAAAFKV